ncbi:MAG: 16S rRNA (cytidine(1402)-2'-O)-methyltransferase [Lachnospiraceae bacterium]|nr:16S rRNA (cytidine(1402)-2'-O)-methyltransferase [Lachnospiraceae bacterium]
MNREVGKLYIVSTPIGNLQDMTFRAVETLKMVDLIAAEDTRHTRELLNHFDISTKLTSYHEHNKFDKANDIVEEIKKGANVAVVTDAGTPIISDPGNELVRQAISENIEVTAVPGACAAVNALVLSGLDAKSFVFIGFLPDDKKKLKEQLDEIKNETRTMIFYISPHNIIDDLKNLITVFGKDRLASISREMTKIHEETLRGSLSDLLENFENRTIKGEFVLIVSGIDKNFIKEQEIDKWLKLSVKEHYDRYISEGLSDKDAIKKVAKDRGVDKRDIYRELKVK